VPTDEIGQILSEARTVAVVGLSPNPERDSHRVAGYLAGAGYTVIPVNPRADEVLGERSYGSLDDLPGPVDLVLVFRRSEEVLPVAVAALRKGAGAFWMQLGIRHAEAAALLRRAGVRVVEDRCAMVEHQARWGSPASSPG
jgi:predicted CoA-binding protein